MSEPEFHRYKELSRKDWGSSAAPVRADLEFGALLRIADAAEVMAQRYQDLIDERDRYKRYHDEELARRRRSEFRIAALKGVITKLKRRGLK